LTPAFRRARLFFKRTNAGIDLFIRLTPRAGSDTIGTVETTPDGRLHLAARVRALPDKGKANQAIERLVAEWLGLPRSSISVVAGATQRLKTISIAGKAEELEALIHNRLGPSSGTR
jgi:hypothetical protein